MKTRVLFAVLLLAPAAAPAVAAQGSSRPARPDSSTEVAEPVAPVFNHGAFNTLLHAHVANGLVDYRAFRGNSQFAQYLASLKTAKLAGMEEAERIAFWLNVYNAYTIQLVASRGETESIRNIDKALGLFRLKGPWSKPFVQAGGRTLTLDDVEHRILRHEFSEPRVHFAMSFAARGGPALRAEAYTGAQLDEQLEDQTRRFVRDTAKNRVDSARYTVYISPVIARYLGDFGGTNTALGGFLAEYFPEGLSAGSCYRRDASPFRPQALPGVPGKADSAKATVPPPRRPSPRWFRVVETPFDWRLNIQQPGARASGS